jgi:hypothetical protein
VIVGQAPKGRRDDVALASKVHYPMGDDPNRRGNSRHWIIATAEGLEPARPGPGAWRYANGATNCSWKTATMFPHVRLESSPSCVTAGESANARCS